MYINKRTFMATIVVLSCLLALVLIPGLFSIVTAPFRGEVSKHEQIEANGSYRIAKYDEFYDMCASIQSKNDQINVLEDELRSTTDKKRADVLQSGITANKNMKAQIVNDYNAQAASNYTAGQMKDSDLPYQIGVNEENVICNAS